MGLDAHDATGVANNAATFQSQGYGFVAQYIDKYSDANTANSPSITPAQAQTDSNAGLQLVSIFQTNGMSSSAGTFYQTYFTASQGMTDAQEAIASAQALGQPAGSAIYFAMDFDPAVYGAAGSEANLLAEVRTYLGSVQTALAQAGYTVGVYGAGDTLAAAIRTSPPVAQYGWLTQSYGWAGSNPQTDANAQNWNIYQGAQTTQNGVAIDPDTASTNSFGAYSVCYVTGTLIRTTRGDVAVEDLVIGDLAVTSSGAHRPIKWLGHRRIDCRTHPRPNEALPIRIAAHAFGPDKPARDLFVSPGHSLCVDVLGEVLIPASALINGSTIQQVEVDAVTYWHVELDSHDILIANGLPAESYMECGDRSFFSEAAIVGLHAIPDSYVQSTADFCRPFIDNGPILDAVRNQLALRAAELGHHSAETAHGPMRGYIDKMNAHVIAGWARDEGSPDTPVCLDIIVDDVLVGRIVANRSRPDLAAAGIGAHAFVLRIDPPLSSAMAHTIEMRRSADGLLIHDGSLAAAIAA